MTTRSQFAIALDALINDTGLFSQSDWARYLRVTEAAISQWMSETTIPRPLKLKLLLMTLEGVSDVPNREPIKAFKEMAQKPAKEVSPMHAHKMLPTVWEYMTRSPFDSGPGDQTNRAPATLEKPAEECIVPMPTTPLPERPVVAS